MSVSLSTAPPEMKLQGDALAIIKTSREMRAYTLDHSGHLVSTVGGHRWVCVQTKLHSREKNYECQSCLGNPVQPEDGEVLEASRRLLEIFVSGLETAIGRKVSSNFIARQAPSAHEKALRREPRQPDLSAGLLSRDAIALHQEFERLNKLDDREFAYEMRLYRSGVRPNITELSETRACRRVPEGMLGKRPLSLVDEKRQVQRYLRRYLLQDDVDKSMMSSFYKSVIVGHPPQNYVRVVNKKLKWCGGYTYVSKGLRRVPPSKYPRSDWYSTHKAILPEISTKSAKAKVKPKAEKKVEGSTTAIPPLTD